MTTSIAPSTSTEADARTAPLTVLFSFLLRADPAANASETDPNLSFETWGDYWRKVHGQRFLHPDEADDRTTISRLLRYDQIHRVASGPTSLNPPPYRPPLDADGRLFETIVGHVEPYRRPQWDGVAYLNFADIDDLGAVLGAERVRRKILPEDQAIFRDLGPVLARQFIIVPNTAGDDAIVLIKTHIRRDDLDRETFQRRWLHDHAELVVGQADTQRLVKRYVQLHNIGPVTEGVPFYHPLTSRIDGVTLLAFASMKDAESFVLSDGYVAIEEAERAIAVVEAGEYWTGLTFTVVDQLAPERASRTS
ncbi:hypothetical protein ANOBCDAF_01134 [Pleomorphomonas sp. T1.2MG-36]|uniref:EthD domain-containing protein n=1 Tax=Pleomorphomonas sp. T1.2MG-36 TaxID=3041167 RepID=UPI002477BA13|nr:EthD domain-containing protein [Pleomorphomonas sp. T1.2MG-36]CAI9404948.1 hypothetical protein ANOBCDAF_01134 [Pleomorphomonas sp. T1.2MG-36]